ncbi:MAG: BON domain-containing protein [Gemmatimonadota bacterium]|nr:BON domain-containing protein [Gemmatimonadota bacterium]
MEQRDEPKHSQYPTGRGYGHDYMRGGEVFGGYGYSERTDYERPRGDASPEAAPDDGVGDPDREREETRPEDASQPPHPHAERIRTLRRPDDDLRNDVREALSFDRWVDAARIAVDVADGVVILAGELATARELRLACDDAWAVAGVREVRSELRVAS